VRVHVLQHVPFEGIGSIQAWMDTRRQVVETTRLFADAALPRPGDVDWLIVMGGPMSVNDESAHAWLWPEKRLIAQAIESGKTVLGICLGAQLIASALGARVFQNPCKEIGWFPVHKSDGARPQPGRGGPQPALAGPQPAVARAFAESHEVFHWHGETFDLPRGSVGFLRSEMCENQAFALGSRVLGLQFHLETTPASAASLIEGSRDEIIPGPTIQTEKEMLSRPERFAAINRLMASVLEQLAAEAVSGEG
jgi:GMP synthase-like glutamine amidotransferase